MSWLKDVLDSMSSVPLPATLAFAGAFSLAESGLGVGMVVPGETVVLVIAASMTDPAASLALLVTVAIASSAGDHIGYLLGRRYGDRLREFRMVSRLGKDRWDEAMRSFKRYGAWSVFLTRLLPLVRTLTPATAGAAGVHYRRFLPASLAGAVMWSTLYVGSGTLARASVHQIGSILTRAGWGVLAGLVVIVCLGFLFRRRRAARTSPE